MNGKVTRYDPTFDQRPAADIVLYIGKSLATWLSPEARDNREREREKADIEHKGEMALIQKAINGDLMKADIDNAKNAAIEHIHATKEVTQEEIRARADVALTEYQEAKALESQKDETSGLFHHD